MDVRIYPSILKGNIEAVSSKALAHRYFVASAVSSCGTEIFMNNRSLEIKATIDALKGLYLNVTANGNDYAVSNRKNATNETDDANALNGFELNAKNQVVIDVKSSANTLRIILPLACSLFENLRFEGDDALTKTAIPELDFLPVSYSSQTLPIDVKGKLKAGTFKLSKEVNGYFLAGLIFALTTLDGDSKIIFPDGANIKQKIAPTLQVVKEFGGIIDKIDDGYLIHGKKLCPPPKITVDTDDFLGAYFLALNALGAELSITNFTEKRKFTETVIKRALNGETISFKDCSGYLALVCVCACFGKNRTVIENVSAKELENAKIYAHNISRMGGNINIDDAQIIVDGTGGLKGGAMVDSFGDSKLAMALSVGASLCKEPTCILSAEAVSKTFPEFFNLLRAVGCKIEVM